MDDMMEKIQALLSDPEAMQNIQELSAMLQNNPDSQPAPPSPQPQEAFSPPSSSQLPIPDISKLFALKQAMSCTDDDKNITLLLALKPHLSHSRKERVDRAIKLLRIYSAASALKEQGMLDELLAGF